MNTKAAQTMPTVPQAFFDEFGVNADDRVMDYGRACYEAGLNAGRHPDALPDGTLSKSTAKRVEALAQQRGAEWSDDLRAVLDAASEASQVPLMWLANQDFSPEQTKAWLCEAVDATVEEGAFSGSLHQVAEEGTGHVVAFTGCGPKSAANAKFLIWCAHFILKHRDALATTPQPSADAVREDR